MKQKCKHNNGCVLQEKICVDEDAQNFNTDFEAVFKCNNFGCNETRKFQFDIKNLTEVEK